MTLTSHIPVPCPPHLTFAAKWMASREASIKARWFQYCPHQDWEDFQADIMVYLMGTDSFVASNPGWRGWVIKAIICRLKNRVRDSMKRLHGLRTVGYMDRLADSGAPDLGALIDARDAVARAGKGTKRVFTHGCRLSDLARVGSARYQRLLQQLNAERATIRACIVPV